VLAASAVTAACGPSGRGLGEPPENVGYDASVATDAAGTDGAQGEAGTGDGSAGDAGTGEGGAGDAGPPDGASGEAGTSEAGTTPPQCNPAFTWSKVARVPSIAAAGFDRFGSVSANELTVAWMSSGGAVFVADRASTSAPFGTPTQLGTGGIGLATGRVALANGGHKLIALAAAADAGAGGASFVSFVRGGDAGTWALDATTEFSNINGMISEGGGTFAEPALSADGYSLFYVLTIPPGTPALYESTWDSSTKRWTFGNPLTNAEFQIASATQLRRPTGASSDRRTLFFFDETTSIERVAWRSSPATPTFDTFVDLSIAPEAAPSESCNTLYFRGMDGSGPGLFTASN
jgi:hypothetical protein